MPTVAAARDLYFYPALKEFMASSQHQRGAVSGKRPRLVAMMTHGNAIVVERNRIQCFSLALKDLRDSHKLSM